MSPTRAACLPIGRAEVTVIRSHWQRGTGFEEVEAGREILFRVRVELDPTASEDVLDEFGHPRLRMTAAVHGNRAGTHRSEKLAEQRRSPLPNGRRGRPGSEIDRECTPQHRPYLSGLAIRRFVRCPNGCVAERRERTERAERSLRGLGRRRRTDVIVAQQYPFVSCR